MEEVKPEIVTGEWIAAQAGDAEAADRILERDYRRTLAAYGDDPAMVHALQLERQGGECMYCHRQFRRTNKVRRPDGSYFDCGAFYWYVPSCGCYQVCSTVELQPKQGEQYGPMAKGCGKHLVYERFANLKWCSSCRPLRKDADGQPREQTRNIARKPYHERNVAEKRWQS